MDIIQEVSQNFIDSAYDTNVNRAFPDARDGLKPGQRACLWTMYKKGHTSDKPHVKSAKIDGEVAAAIWPHGTTAIYETFARMSQPFTNNVPEVDFHGANGNVILGGSAIAADRYSEARLSVLAEKYMLNGCDKNAVDMQLNFSEDELWPTVLPSIFPRLLVNGSQGIGVSIANSWCLHGLTDTVGVLKRYIEIGEVDNDNYFPDWPCGATIINKDELSKINKTGKGKIVTEAKYSINGNDIEFTEFPFQVYIEPLIEEIKGAIESDKVHNVTNVFNKSDKNRILLSVTCSNRGKIEDTVEELMSSTSLRSQFNVNQVAIVGKTPKLLTLENMCHVYVEHNLSCIKRMAEFDHAETGKRVEILNGLLKALENIDSVIKLIRNSESSASAKESLVGSGFTEKQADAIMVMRLSKLSHLETEQIKKELAEKTRLLTRLEKIIKSESEQKKILLKRLDSLVKDFGDARRTEVMSKKIKKKARNTPSINKNPEVAVITYDGVGYMQNIPAPKSGGINRPFFCRVMTNERVILFTNHGRYFRIAPSDIKVCGPRDKGTAIGSVVDFEPNEKVIHITTTDGENDIITFVSEDGKVKRTRKNVYSGTTRNLKGMAAMKTNGNVIISDKQGDAIKITSESRSITFAANEVKESGKMSAGVAGISLKDGDKVVGVDIFDSKNYNCVMQNRGGRGVVL